MPFSHNYAGDSLAEGRSVLVTVARAAARDHHVLQIGVPIENEMMVWRILILADA